MPRGRQTVRQTGGSSITRPQRLSALGGGSEPAGLSPWGHLIAAGRNDLAFAPRIVLTPEIVLSLTILAFNFLGDALLDAVDPEATTEAER
jgi:peptide/nickel transport system permease protein